LASFLLCGPLPMSAITFCWTSVVAQALLCLRLTGGATAQAKSFRGICQ
jgi:hypothetical protein